MKLPSDVTALLVRRFQRKHRDWLADAAAGADWPLTVSLEAPTEAAAMKQMEAVRAWINAWRGWRGEGRLEWAERQWRVIGTQRLPVSLTLDAPRQAAAWADEEPRWTRAAQRFAALGARWPQLAPILPAWFPVLADYDEVDFQRLLDVAASLAGSGTSGLYLRQLPLAGVDTKWIEPRTALLADWVGTLRRACGSDQDLYQLCGLRRLPVRLRMRVLDPGLRRLVGGLGDITAPVAEIAQLDLPVQTVLIVENLQSGLALEDMPGTVAVMALGYGVDLLAQVPWIADASCIYWGDIDTHGYAILSRARRHLPRVSSVLMDEATLFRFRDLWGFEDVQCSADDPALLTADERGVYAGLKECRWGRNVRLEQERIDWRIASDIIARAASACQIPSGRSLDLYKP